MTNFVVHIHTEMTYTLHSTNKYNVQYKSDVFVNHKEIKKSIYRYQNTKDGAYCEYGLSVYGRPFQIMTEKKSNVVSPKRGRLHKSTKCYECTSFV